MSSSRSKGKSKSSNSSHVQYPTPWSEWAWTAEYNTHSRYRLKAPGDYEYDYDEGQPEDVPSSSTVPDNSLYPISEQYSGVASQSNYTIAPSPSTDSMETITQGLSAASLQSPATGEGLIPRSVPEPVSQGHIATKNPSSTKEVFDDHYKVHHAREFQVLSIFKVLWTEPKGNGGGNQGSVGNTEYSERRGKYGEKSYEKVRRFVIIDRREGHCICLPIMTYGGQGTLKGGVHPDDHTVIHTTEKPVFLKDEVKRGLKRSPIRVRPNQSRHHLDKASRLNYAKVYTVEYNVKVWFVGKIHRDSEWQIGVDYNDVHPPIALRGQPRLPAAQDVYSHTGGGTGASTYATQTLGYPATTSNYPGASGTTPYSTENYPAGTISRTIAPNPEAPPYYPPQSSSSYQPDEYAAKTDQYYGGKGDYYDER